MRVKLLDDYGSVKAGTVLNIPDMIAKELISKGIAMKENTLDKEAYDSLNDAKSRDNEQANHSGGL